MSMTGVYTQTVPPEVAKYQCMVSAYPQALQSVHKLKELVRDCKPTDHYELELRFHTTRGLGVSSHVMDRLEASFNKSRHWSKVEDWHVVCTHYHASSIPDDQRELRTQIIFNPGAGDESAVVNTEVKKTVQNLDLVTESIAAQAAGNEGEMKIRVALARESVVPKEHIPAETQSTKVHIKERKCYYYTSKSLSMDALDQRHEPTWMYCLTRRWTGMTYVEAQTNKMRRRESAICEIEVELLNPAAMLQVQCPERVAFSILQIAHGILNFMDDSRFGNPQMYSLQPTNTNLLWAKNRQPAA